MIPETSEFVFSHFQDDRVWIHSNSLGWGMWVCNSEIEKFFTQSNNKTQRGGK